MLGTMGVEREQRTGGRAGRRLRFVVVGISLLLLLPVIGLIGAQGAQNWCQGSETSFSNQKLSLSLWPPGVHCSLDVPDKGSVERYWPINW